MPLLLVLCCSSPGGIPNGGTGGHAGGPCPANVGSADDCPMPLTGTAERMCNFSLCDLSCRGGLVCPDGMQCLGGSDCRWPAP
jgi:hypothetical protein